MKRIVIINQDSGYLMIDIANAFREIGYEVILVTGRLVERNTALDKSIKLEKIIQYKRTNIFSKVLTWCVAFVQIIIKLRLKYANDPLLIVTNPPIAPLIPLICNNPYSLLIFDIYIEIFEELPYFNSRSSISKFWKKAHLRVLKNADNIYTLTEGMRALLEKYSEKKKCKVLPLWTDNDFLKPIPATENPFLHENDLLNKFIVLYSGSIGASNGIENLIDVASMINNDHIVFLIIGEGFKKKIIQKKIKNLNLKNCLLLPWQKPHLFPFSLASANLAVVSLIGSSSYYSIPSKVFNYMSVGAPVLCLSKPDSDIQKLVDSEKIGKSFDPSNSKEIADYIKMLYLHPEIVRELSQNSLQASKKYSKDNLKEFLQNTSLRNLYSDVLNGKTHT